ncbi:MAG: hypothetical protein ABH891_05565 [Candidatus Omnitrophota bacterium]
MIFEYALDPNVAAKCYHRNSAKDFKGEFGIGKPRILSRFPKDWKKKVEGAYQKEVSISPPQNPQEEAKRQQELHALTEFIQSVCEVMVQRVYHNWREGDSWLENALSAHESIPFQAIVAEVATDLEKAIINPKDLKHEGSAKWEMSLGETINMEPVAMAQAVSPMLRICQFVKFIDPHFSPEDSKITIFLKHFLEELCKYREEGSLKDIVVEMHVNFESCNSKDPKYFKDCCEKLLPRCIPKGLKVTFIRWRKREGGDELHNRYILTDCGGILLGRSFHLKTVAKERTDDISLIDRKIYDKRWKDYSKGAQTFTCEEEIIIEGAAKLPEGYLLLGG